MASTVAVWSLQLDFNMMTCHAAVAYNVLPFNCLVVWLQVTCFQSVPTHLNLSMFSPHRSPNMASLLVASKQPSQLNCTPAAAGA